VGVNFVLSPRQRLILAAIVEDYVLSAEPVGSRALSKHGEIHFSPATIRNDMADLEEMGYLDQPHTSAGRIPSNKGYRFYVDHLLLQNSTADVSGLGQLRNVFVAKMNEVEHMIQQTAIVLSQLTKYTSIVVGPTLQQERVKRIDLVPLAKGQTVLLFVTDSGRVENSQIQLSEDLKAEDISRMVALLNSKLVGVPLTRLKSQSYRQVAVEMADALEHYEDALAILDQLETVGQTVDDRFYVGGTSNMFAQPEFRDIDKVMPLLAIFEQATSIQQVFPVLSVHGVHVRIGMENQDPTLQDCAVVSATYTVGGVPVGTVGLLGPTRMNYARVIRIMDYVSTSLTQVLTRGAKDS